MRSGPGLERPHWPRAITGRERDRQPAGWTDDGGTGRKSTGSAAPHLCFVVVPQQGGTRCFKEEKKKESKQKLEKASMTRLIATAREEQWDSELGGALFSSLNKLCSSLGGASRD